MNLAVDLNLGAPRFETIRQQAFSAKLVQIS